MPTESVLRYRGSSNHYIDVASRGTEHLGIGLDYQTHHTGIGAIIVRFVAHSSSGQYSDFTHFRKRERAQYLETLDGKTQLNTRGVPDPDKMFTGFRLDKIAVPVFAPAPRSTEFLSFADKADLWSAFASWITEQANLDGFQIDVTDLPGLLRSLFATLDPDQVKLVLTFPDLTELHKAKAQHYVPTAESDEDPDDDDEDDDEDEDDDDDDPDDGKGTVN